MITALQDLLELDEEFRENHMALLERFYKIFDSILKVCRSLLFFDWGFAGSAPRFFCDLQYQQDYYTYMEELIEGVFVQHTVEACFRCSVFLNSVLCASCPLTVHSALRVCCKMRTAVS